MKKLLNRHIVLPLIELLGEGVTHGSVRVTGANQARSKKSFAPTLRPELTVSLRRGRSNELQMSIIDAPLS
jgi:hypothetical protein